MPLPVKQALQRAAAQSAHGPAFGVNECQMQCRLLYEVPSNGTLTAADDWNKSKNKHTGNPHDAPVGAFHRWTGGSTGAGHVAVSQGAGSVWSTDIKRPGYFDLTTVDHINQAWTHLHYVGWTTDIDGVVCV
ncbi:hypothetical protein [Nocardioides plantarum]|uniref:Peptidase C51 domain-containing protein n=1 Tax=Nocardioides plantarum TaxID=29299 RepID=A0ABV5KF68_9ACTN|nr:hypothetical protein [Nocardioides plantarum]